MRITKAPIRCRCPRNRLDYRAAGVDIEAGDALVEAIKPLARATSRAGVMGGLGGFGALFDLKAAGFRDPVLVSTTDGVGTKLKIAIETGMHDTVGIDLVAMCVNDLVVQGAEPLFFLDYFATGKLDRGERGDGDRRHRQGCREAGCALVGGETAEMPGMYAGGDYDLAGFAVGAAERGSAAAAAASRPATRCSAWPASGVHSNGFSLVRRVVEASRAGLGRSGAVRARAVAGRGADDADADLRGAVLALHRAGLLKAAAHITGGGLPGNLPRVLPDGHGGGAGRQAWTVPPVFRWLARAGGVAADEMLRVFNCGIGMALVVVRSAMPRQAVLEAQGEIVCRIGVIDGHVPGPRRSQLGLLARLAT